VATQPHWNSQVVSVGRGTTQLAQQLTWFVMLSLQWGYYLLACCPLPGLPISQVQERYGAPLLLEALDSFLASNAALCHHHRVHAFNQLNIYKYITILSPPKQHISDTKWFFKLHATSVQRTGPRTTKGLRTGPGLDHFRTGLQSWSYQILKSISPGPLLFWGA